MTSVRAFKSFRNGCSSASGIRRQADLPPRSSRDESPGVNGTRDLCKLGKAPGEDGEVENERTRCCSGRKDLDRGGFQTTRFGFSGEVVAGPSSSGAKPPLGFASRQPRCPFLDVDRPNRLYEAGTARPMSISGPFRSTQLRRARGSIP